MCVRAESTDRQTVVINAHGRFRDCDPPPYRSGRRAAVESSRGSPGGVCQIGGVLSHSGGWLQACGYPCSRGACAVGVQCVSGIHAGWSELPSPLGRLVSPDSGCHYHRQSIREAQTAASTAATKCLKVLLGENCALHAGRGMDQPAQGPWESEVPAAPVVETGGNKAPYRSATLGVSCFSPSSRGVWGL